MALSNYERVGKSMELLKTGLAPRSRNSLPAECLSAYPPFKHPPKAILFAHRQITQADDETHAVDCG